MTFDELCLLRENTLLMTSHGVQEEAQRLLATEQGRAAQMEQRLAGPATTDGVHDTAKMLGLDLVRHGQRRS